MTASGSQPAAPSAGGGARRGAQGVALSLAAAVISGFAVFTNGYGVQAFGDPAVYTTAKNLVATVVLTVMLLAVAGRRRQARPGPSRDAHGGAEPGRAGPGQGGVFTRPHGWKQWAGLVMVAVIGGSVPFVLFFRGLAEVSSPNAAFIQKTLVVWVALLALPLLRERIGPLHVVAIALLVAGQAVLGGGVAGIGASTGTAMIFAATLLWSAETIVAKRLLASLSPLTVGTARMGFGVVLLACYVLATTRWSEFAAIGPRQWSWAAATGLILAAYVAVWLAALARARAIDVTAILVLGAVITAALQAAAGGLAGAPLGLALVTAGCALAILLALRKPRRAAAAP